MKLCKDCTHFIGSFEVEDRCFHPTNTYQEPVRGLTKCSKSPRELRSAFISSELYCGQEAGWWLKKV